MIKEQEITSSQFPEEYLDAQRAAVEAVDVGRATLEETERQGEQLRNADRLADQTKYCLEESKRVLRGMTWTGWVQNLMTRNTNSPVLDSKPILMEDIPPFAKNAAQAVQNYQANLSILDECENVEQREMCQSICKDMFEVATKEVYQLPVKKNPTVIQQLSSQLTKLNQYQIDITEKHLKLRKKQIEMESNSLPPESSGLSGQQDEHLNILASNLAELNIMAGSLHEQLGQHNKLMSQLEDKSENIYDQTRSVTRRADRLMQKKSWVPTKRSFEKWISIKHIETGRYLSVSNKNITLSDTFHPEKCVFGVWKKPNGLIGLKSKYTNLFLGQTMMGYLSCSSKRFGQREDWQPDDDWENSRLLIASAGWGEGSYLAVKDSNFTITMVSDKRKADFWCLTVQEDS